MKKQTVIISENISESINQILKEHNPDKLFVLTDKNTYKLCLPILQETGILIKANIITLGNGDIYKNIQSLTEVWQYLSVNGATRRSILFNLGGGMITDLGGFAASTFKRGMNYVNIPTTLLSMVDAAVGGKTGINFNGLKNEIGVFSPASYVIVNPQFLKTLDQKNFLSGYAEMLKHGLINDNESWQELIDFDINHINYETLKDIIGRSIKIKEKIVEEDPFEQNIRKALNLGHTTGHAFESLALEENRPVLHGYAVAWGIICELYLSHIKLGFPKEKLKSTIQFIRQNYDYLYFECDKYDRLYELMTHDKKNVSDYINFTLLKNVGDICIDQTATKKEIFDMLDFYRDAVKI